MKVPDYDNIHRAIKYGIWTSNMEKIMNLHNSYLEAKNNGVKVYLLFACAKQKCYTGIAEIVGEFEAGKTFKYWREELRWFGHFPLKWHYIKNIYFDG